MQAAELIKILAQAIIDAGGDNVSVKIATSEGDPMPTDVAGYAGDRLQNSPTSRPRYRVVLW